MMKPGKYYVGDLCYVMHDRWDEFCDKTIDGHSCLSGEFKLDDGTVVASYNTMYGDGVYTDDEGREYGVDAGLIGCIRVEDIAESELKNLGDGNVIEFEDPFITGRTSAGTIFFGRVEIMTGDGDEDEDDY